MRFYFAAIAFTALAAFFTVTIASPIPWPEEKLEEINALRAEGVPEVFIISVFVNLARIANHAS